MAKFKIGDKVRILDGSKIKGYTGGWNSTMAKRVGEVYAISKVYDDYPDGRVSYRLDIPTLRYEFTWDERGLEAACKFKVGDKVIGNKKANRYGITREGWIGTVTNVNDNEIWVKGPAIHTCVFVDPECFDLISTDKIVITTDGKTTTAVLYDGKKRIKEAKAVCAPDDEFDFNKGAAIALERLTGQACGKVENTLEVKSQMDRFIKGEIALKVPKEKIDKFLKECEKRELKWCGGKKATEWAPDKGWPKVNRIFHDCGALQHYSYDMKGYKYEDWEETEEDLPKALKSLAAIAAMADFMKFMKDELDD